MLAQQHKTNNSEVGWAYLPTEINFKGEKMKKILVLSLLFSMILLNSPVLAATHKAHASKSKHHDTHGVNHEVTPKSIGAGALSLLIWPGIGQLMNDGDNAEKAATHAIIGFFPLFRIWSCYDGVVDRKGGVWDNRI